ncbi:hypothetical protein [Sphingomonas phage Kimi]|nr:hypothetical protein [Sphingomonas phage Kimi]
MRKRADVIETSASEIAVAGTKAMLEELVYVTPVDTSQALSNWQVNLGNPAPDELPPYYAGSRGSTAGASSRQAIEEGFRELTYKKPGQPIFLSNLVDYIKKLDEGSSSQFPGGFVPRALLVFRIAAEEARKRIFK